MALIEKPEKAKSTPTEEHRGRKSRWIDDTQYAWRKRAVNLKKEYKTVNEALNMFGEAPIEVPLKGSDKEKMEFLLNSYAEKLKTANPQYGKFKDNQQIPEMIVQYLVSVINKGTQ